MFYLTVIAFSIFNSNAQNLIKICFTNPDGLIPDFKLAFIEGLPFIPNVVKLTAILKENSYRSQIGVLRSESYILLKTIHTCQENFAYEVPLSPHPIMTLELKFTWGLQEFLLDSLMTIFKPDFLTSTHRLEGSRSLIWVNIFLRHETSPPKPRPIPQSHIQPEYSKILRPLYSGEFHCVSVFTNDFRKTLFFSSPPVIHGQTSGYYVLTIGVFSNFLNDNFEVKKYLVKIIPCELPVNFDEKLKLFIDPSTPGIQFELSDGKNVFLHASEYSLYEGIILTHNIVKDFVFGNIDIEIKPLAHDMVHRNIGLLLYLYRLSGRKCQVRVPENLDDLQLSFVLERKNKDIVLKSLYLAVDMKTKQLKVYNRRPGTREEYEKCMKE